MGTKNATKGQLTFNVEEFHRGKWQPLMVEKNGKDVQKRVKISQDEADIMNNDKEAYKLRYVMVKIKKGGSNISAAQKAKETVKAIGLATTVEAVNGLMGEKPSKSVKKSGEAKITELTK